MNSKVIKTYFSTLIFFFVICFLSLIIDKIAGSIAKPYLLFNKESVFYELLSFDYLQFLQVGILCLTVSSFVVYLSTSFCIHFLNINPHVLEKRIYALAKILSSISIILPMTLVFNKEQFNVVTTYVSFLALFSFAVPRFKK